MVKSDDRYWMPLFRGKKRTLKFWMTACLLFLRKGLVIVAPYKSETKPILPSSNVFAFKTQITQNHSTDYWKLPIIHCDFFQAYDLLKMLPHFALSHITLYPSFFCLNFPWNEPLQSWHFIFNNRKQNRICKQSNNAIISIQNQC